MASPNTRNPRVKRELAKRAPKIIENVKSALFIKGPKASEIVNQCLKDLYIMKKPNSKLLTKRNMTRPFEDQNSVEFLADKNDTGLFAYASHSKKRPHNLVFGRIFDGVILDMFEMGLNGQTFKSISEFNTRGAEASFESGAKPVMIFQGEEFESNLELAQFKNLMLDFFRGQVLEKINLAGLKRAIICTAFKGVVYLRQYAIVATRTGGRAPTVELKEVGPSLDLTLRRSKSAPDDLRKHSLAKAKVMKTKKTKGGVTRSTQKNIEKGPMDSKGGRLHLDKQDFNEIAVKKMKGLRKPKRKAAAQPEQAQEGEPAGEGQKAPRIEGLD